MPEVGLECGGFESASPSPSTSSAIIAQTAVRGSTGSSIDCAKKYHRNPQIHAAARQTVTAAVILAGGSRAGDPLVVLLEVTGICRVDGII